MIVATKMAKIEENIISNNNKLKILILHYINMIVVIEKKWMKEILDKIKFRKISN